MVIKRCCIYSNTQGVRNLKETDLNPMYVLIKPPSMEVLEKRLRDRKTETKESLQKRLDVAREELAYGKRTNYTRSVLQNAYSVKQAMFAPLCTVIVVKDCLKCVFFE